MISKSATLTSHNRITIPAVIIKNSGLKIGQKIAFTFNDGLIEIKPVVERSQ